MFTFNLIIFIRLLELTFLVGENRTRSTTRRLTHPSIYNELMLGIKVIREFSRRSRQLDLSVLKAQEFRNIILFLFPVVIQCIEPEAKERRVWLLLAFMLRACIVPELEYEKITTNEIMYASNQFYCLFEKLFSAKNCTYSVHIIGSHLPQMRSKGPLTETSAFIFENFYGEMRNAFRPGTVSTLKQIMERTYLKRILTFHACQKEIYYSPKDTQLERNSLIYVYENDTYNMYKINQIETPNLFLCAIQGRIEIEFNEAQDLDWSKVGVFKEGATGNEIIPIRRETIHGKVLKICSLLITCPLNIMNEK